MNVRNSLDITLVLLRILGLILSGPQDDESFKPISQSILEAEMLVSMGAMGSKPEQGKLYRYMINAFV